MSDDPARGHDTAELPGDLVPLSHVEHCFHRYQTALSEIEGRDVLEVACGAGQGLSYLAGDDRRVVGLERSAFHLDVARRGLDDGITLVRGDAHGLPFADRRFDAVVLLEAIYFLESPHRFVDEAMRVLRPGGRLVVESINPAWPGFDAHRLAARYLGSVELYHLLADAGFDVMMSAAFPRESSARARLIGVVRSGLRALGLRPRAGRLRDLLRRLAYGRLVPFPARVGPGSTPYVRPRPIEPELPDSKHLYIYAVGTRPG